MAIGDQVHWIGSTYASANIQPSSGVEVILKDVVTSNSASNYSSNYSWAYYRTSSTSYSYAVIGGAGRDTYIRSSAEGSTYFDSGSGQHNRAIPINNGNYMTVTYAGTGGHWRIGGFITKD